MPTRGLGRQTLLKRINLAHKTTATRQITCERTISTAYDPWSDPWSDPWAHLDLTLTKGRGGRGEGCRCRGNHWDGARGDGWGGGGGLGQAWGAGEQFNVF